MTRLGIALLLFLPAIPIQAEEENLPPLIKYEWGKPVSLPTQTPAPDFEKDILEKLRAKQAEEERKRDEQALLEAAQRVFIPQARESYIPASPRPYTASQGGYIMAGNNCVECVYQMTGRRQNGNAGSWQPSSSTPWVGAIMIWWAGEQGASGSGHVGVVQSINPDGTINIAHCNWWGGQTTFASTHKFW